MILAPTLVRANVSLVIYKKKKSIQFSDIIVISIHSKSSVFLKLRLCIIRRCGRGWFETSYGHPENSFFIRIPPCGCPFLLFAKSVSCAPSTFVVEHASLSILLHLPVLGPFPKLSSLVNPTMSSADL